MAIKISDLLPKPVEVEVGTGTLVVNALDLKGITRVVQKHRETILHLIATAQKGKPDFAGALEQAPDMVATIIALAADAEGQEEDIRKLPGTVQLTAMAEIWKVSVPDVKKLLSSLSGVMARAKTAPPVPNVEQNPQ
jgi:hypothetical protein